MRGRIVPDSGSGGDGDPFFADVDLLVPIDTDLSDLKLHASVSFNGSVTSGAWQTTGSDQAVFGYSLPDLMRNNTNWTIEVIASYTDSANQSLIGCDWYAGNNGCWVITFSGSPAAVTVGLQNSGITYPINAVATSLTTGSSDPYTFTFQREGNVYSLYIDNDRVAQATLGAHAYWESAAATYNGLGFGSRALVNGANGGWLGKIFAVRCTKATRYAGSPATITAATEPFPES
jgi:hypothetical protein